MTSPCDHGRGFFSIVSFCTNCLLYKVHEIYNFLSPSPIDAKKKNRVKPGPVVLAKILESQPTAIIHLSDSGDRKNINHHYGNTLSSTKIRDPILFW